MNKRDEGYWYSKGVIEGRKEIKEKLIEEFIEDMKNTQLIRYKIIEKWEKRLKEK